MPRPQALVMNMQTHDERSAKIAERMNKIKRKIGIVSGKGGVGKSAVTGLLACAFASKGNKVGILDADITGPSIPRMFGVAGMPADNETEIVPPETKNGLKIMSMNLLLQGEDQPVIWRGPLLSNTTLQFLSDIEWGELDYLFIDFPPGTGDIPLSLMQSAELDGIIFVTSPQELAFMIVSKTIKMAKKIGLPIIGIVENMSYLKCPYCTGMIYPFGKSKLDEMAAKSSTTVLGRLPFDDHISGLSDVGEIESYVCKELTGITDNVEKYFTKQQP